MDFISNDKLFADDTSILSVINDPTVSCHNLNSDMLTLSQAGCLNI